MTDRTYPHDVTVHESTMIDGGEGYLHSSVVHQSDEIEKRLLDDRYIDYPSVTFKVTARCPACDDGQRMRFFAADSAPSGPIPVTVRQGDGYWAECERCDYRAIVRPALPIAWADFMPDFGDGLPTHGQAISVYEDRD
jgi:hypothetical protein